MLRLILFDIALRLRASRRSVYLGHVDGLGRLPLEARPDLGMRGDLLFTRAIAETNLFIANRRLADKQRLLSVLSSIATRRGFPPLTWGERDAP